jgi:hypothetical protein
VVVEAASLVNGQLDNPLGAWGQSDLAHHHAVPSTDDELDRRTHFIQFYAQIVENASGNAIALTYQPQEYMFRSYVIVVEALRFFLRKL